jgi:hypothetical protein
MIRICGVSVYTLLAAVIFTAPVLGQIGVNTVTARFGIIDAPNANKQIFYPELEIGGKAFLPSLGWSAYWGYWDEAIRETAVSDQAVYSTRGQILGGRILFDPSKALDRWVLPVIIFVGISHQFISPTYVGGSDLTGNTIYRGPDSGTSIELGGACRR